MTGSDRVFRLPIVLILGLMLRLAWGLIQPTDTPSLAKLPDQREYLQLADNLLHRHTLVMTDPHWGDDVYAYRMPGYPLFVAGLGASVRWVRIAQAFLDTSTALAACLLARRWLGRRGAIVAALLVAVNPFLICFSGLVLSETLYTAMLAWGMALLLGTFGRAAEGVHPRPEGRASSAKKKALPSAAWLNGNRLLLWRSELGALLLALSVLVRPSAIGLPVVLGIGAALLNRHRPGAYPRTGPLGPAGAMVLLIALVLLPWAYRNSRVLHHWIWTTTNGGITAYDGFNDDATGASDQRFAAHVRLSLPELSNATEVERDRYLGDQAVHWGMTHPGRALELARDKIIRTWSPMPLSSDYGRPTYRIMGLLFSVPLDVLILLGLTRPARVNPPGSPSGWLPRSGKVLMLLPAIYLTVVHAMSVGSLRYRLPADPALAVVAAAGWMRFIETRTGAADPEKKIEPQMDTDEHG